MSLILFSEKNVCFRLLIGLVANLVHPNRHVSCRAWIPVGLCPASRVLRELVLDDHHPLLMVDAIIRVSVSYRPLVYRLPR